MWTNARNIAKDALRLKYIDSKEYFKKWTELKPHPSWCKVSKIPIHVTYIFSSTFVIYSWPWPKYRFTVRLDVWYILSFCPHIRTTHLTQLFGSRFNSLNKISNVWPTFWYCHIKWYLVIFAIFLFQFGYINGYLKFS